MWAAECSERPPHNNLLSVDVITAEGESAKASENENVDLFWGVRGGGGNFGIVTEFKFRLDPLGPHVVAAHQRSVVPMTA